MDNNPYTAPSSAVESTNTTLGFHEPHFVGVGKGFSWVGEGFSHFKRDPGPWILICIVGFVILVALSIVPIVSMITGVLTYVWIGGLMLGCRAQDEGESITISHLFAGFQHKFGPLLLLGVIVVIASMLVMLAAMGPMYAQMLGASVGGDAAGMEAMFSGDIVQTIVLPMLIGMLFIVPLMAAAWYAPMLIIFNDVPLLQAMVLSFKGCIKNIVPLFINGLVMGILGFLLALPLLLGWLIFMPMFYGVMYRSYKDIYVD